VTLRELRPSTDRLAASARCRGGALLAALLAAASLLAVLAGLAGAQAPVPDEDAAPTPDEDATPADLRRAGLVSVRAQEPSIRLDVRYATRRNFTGRRLPGYCRPLAVLRPFAAGDLAAVQRRLAPRGLGLVVYDAYRPVRATRAMVRWAERTGNSHLVRQGYIARRSRHNEGATVDLGLVSSQSGRPLDMGTPYDSFSTRSHTRNARGRALGNRMTLVRAMAAEGFRNYRREWWHFDHRRRGGRPLDVTLGC
jgi:D-alanyl-D-alanine dipeptidase